MPQVLVQPRDISGDRFEIRGPEAHHVLRVLRKQVNDEIEFFDGRGACYKGRLTAVDPREPRAEGKITEQMTTTASSAKISVFQGLPKGPKFDYVLEKATELGAAAIYPFLSAKNPVLLTPSQAEAKARRWASLVKAASKQCGRTTLPRVEPAHDLYDLAGLIKDHTTLVLWEKETEVSLKSALTVLPLDRPMAVVVGPESGFDPKEIEWLKKQGGQTVSLGKRTLRTETAGLAVLAIINYELGL